MVAVRFALLAAMLVACSGSPRLRPAWPDAPVVLRDDAERALALDQLWVLPRGVERDRARAAIAAAIAARITDAIEEERPFAAAALLDQLTSMWQPDPGAIGVGLAAHAPLMHQLRAMFAKAGSLEPALQTLIVLAEIEPADRDGHVAEIEEILAFADELANATNGADARRSQPIALLQPTALSLPLPGLVARYTKLLTERQIVIAKLINERGASMALVRAHHDILTTARRIANVLARAGRVTEIHGRLAVIKGIGSDRELAVRAEIVAEQPTPAAYVELALELRLDEHTADPAAALAVSLAGLRRFPANPALLLAAATDAHALGRIAQPIALFEAALRGDREVDAATALVLGRLYGTQIARLAGAGRPAAARAAWRDARGFTDEAARVHPHSAWQQVAAIASAALGRGLAGQGLIPAARRELVASLARAPSIDAYETLTSIEIRTDAFTSARGWAASGLELLGDQTSGDRYRRAKLLRLDADALRGAGRTREAATSYLEALRSWASLGETQALPAPIAAERLLDVGRVMWWLGDPDRAIASVMEAVDLAADTPEVSAGAVSLLLELGRFHDAIDAYHRGLGAELSDEHKVGMTLWIAAEARRRGAPLDRLAAEYLASRHGDTWHELLARCASGRLSIEVLRAAATTGPRRAELAFYGAALGLEPEAATAEGKRRLLTEVVAAHVIFDTEYTLARRYLSAP